MVAVAPRLLQALLAVGITPVVSPISLGNDGEFLNVNADEAATALAGAMGVDALTFLSNVPGVLDADGRLLGSLTAAESETLIANGVIAGGMVPKVRAGLRALAQGVGIVRIVDLGGFVVGAGTGIRG